MSDRPPDQSEQADRGGPSDAGRPEPTGRTERPGQSPYEAPQVETIMAIYRAFGELAAGDMDVAREAFESITLLQTGKSQLSPWNLPRKFRSSALTSGRTGSN